MSHPWNPPAVQKAPALFFDPDGAIPTRFGVSLGIFLVSLFGEPVCLNIFYVYVSLTLSTTNPTRAAVSFPSLSKSVKYVRIPSIVFFLGKHFGTGVILATAFVHLLPDAFKSLDSHWTGLIVCVSPFLLL